MRCFKAGSLPWKLGLPRNALAKECYSMKLDLLTNPTVVDDAMKFVSEHNKKQVKEIPSVASAKEEGETTTNQVF